MSKHTIHGHQVEISVSQGELSELSRGRCIGRIVNLCRAMSANEFGAAMADLKSNPLQGGEASAKMLAELDAALAAGYTTRCNDDYAPIANIKVIA